MSSWDEFQAELERLAAEGFSSGLIGERFGITRNAVIGRCHRTGVKLRGEKRIEVCRGPNSAPKTHCKHGHAFDAANTYFFPDGRRQCRTCRREVYPSQLSKREQRRQQEAA